MKAHIVGGGFGGLAAVAFLIHNGGVPGPDIKIYEADDRIGGGFFLGVRGGQNSRSPISLEEIAFGRQ